MEKELISKFAQYIKKTDEGDNAIQLKEIIKYLLTSKNQKKSLNDIFNCDELKHTAIDKRVDLSWIKNDSTFCSQGEIDVARYFEEKTRMFGLINSFKTAGDYLVRKTDISSVDEDFYPIMTCYTQFVELVLKNFMRNRNVKHDVQSHNIYKLWKNAEERFKSENNENVANLINEIIELLYKNDNPEIEKKGLIIYRYLKPLHNREYALQTENYELNVWAVCLFVDIFDSAFRYTFDGDLKDEPKEILDKLGITIIPTHKIG